MITKHLEPRKFIQAKLVSVFILETLFLMCYINEKKTLKNGKDLFLNVLFCSKSAWLFCSKVLDSHFQKSVSSWSQPKIFFLVYIIIWVFKQLIWFFTSDGCCSVNLGAGMGDCIRFLVATMDRDFLFRTYAGSLSLISTSRLSPEEDAGSCKWFGLLGLIRRFSVEPPGSIDAWD